MFVDIKPKIPTPEETYDFLVRDIIYHTAAIGVVEHLDGTSHHHENSRQRYFKGHDDDIVCLTTDPTAKFVATGQMQSEHERKVLPAVKCGMQTLVGKSAP